MWLKGKGLPILCRYFNFRSLLVTRHGLRLNGLLSFLVVRGLRVMKDGVGQRIFLHLVRDLSDHFRIRLTNDSVIKGARTIRCQRTRESEYQDVDQILVRGRA